MYLCARIPRIFYVLYHSQSPAPHVFRFPSISYVRLPRTLYIYILCWCTCWVSDHLDSALQPIRPAKKLVWVCRVDKCPQVAGSGKPWLRLDFGCLSRRPLIPLLFGFVTVIFFMVNFEFASTPNVLCMWDWPLFSLVVTIWARSQSFFITCAFAFSWLSAAGWGLSTFVVRVCGCSGVVSAVKK